MTIYKAAVITAIGNKDLWRNSQSTNITKDSVLPPFPKVSVTLITQHIRNILHKIHSTAAPHHFVKLLPPPQTCTKKC